MTMAATITTKHVADTVCSGEAGCFMHGPTFMGNPLASAVANASLQLLKDTPWQEKVLTIESHLAHMLPPLETLTAVKGVRWLGAIGVVELNTPVHVESIQKHFVESGVWIRPFGRLIYIMPPFDMREDQLQKLVDAIEHAVESMS